VVIVLCVHMLHTHLVCSFYNHGHIILHMFEVVFFFYPLIIIHDTGQVTIISIILKLFLERLVSCMNCIILFVFWKR
jgi:hypothetical protein